MLLPAARDAVTAAPRISRTNNNGGPRKGEEGLQVVGRETGELGVGKDAGCVAKEVAEIFREKQEHS